MHNSRSGNCAINDKGRKDIFSTVLIIIDNKLINIIHLAIGIRGWKRFEEGCVTLLNTIFPWIFLTVERCELWVGSCQHF